MSYSDVLNCYKSETDLIAESYYNDCIRMNELLGFGKNKKGASFEEMVTWLKSVNYVVKPEEEDTVLNFLVDMILSDSKLPNKIGKNGQKALIYLTNICKQNPSFANKVAQVIPSATKVITKQNITESEARELVNVIYGTKTLRESSEKKLIEAICRYDYRIFRENGKLGTYHEELNPDVKNTEGKELGNEEKQVVTKLNTIEEPKKEETGETMPTYIPKKKDNKVKKFLILGGVLLAGTTALAMSPLGVSIAGVLSGIPKVGLALSKGFSSLGALGWKGVSKLKGLFGLGKNTRTSSLGTTIAREEQKALKNIVNPTVKNLTNTDGIVGTTNVSKEVETTNALVSPFLLQQNNPEKYQRMKTAFEEIWKDKNKNNEKILNNTSIKNFSFSNYLANNWNTFE